MDDPATLAAKPAVPVAPSITEVEAVSAAETPQNLEPVRAEPFRQVVQPRPVDDDWELDDPNAVLAHEAPFKSPPAPGWGRIPRPCP